MTILDLIWFTILFCACVYSTHMRKTKWLINSICQPSIMAARRHSWFWIRISVIICKLSSNIYNDYSSARFFSPLDWKREQTLHYHSEFPYTVRCRTVICYNIDHWWIQSKARNSQHFLIRQSFHSHGTAMSQFCGAW